MQKQMLVVLMLLIMGTSLSSLDTVKGLGSYFAYLIPDVEQDIRTFPDRLALLEKRFVEVGTEQNGSANSYLNIAPVIGAITTRHEVKFISHGSTNPVQEGIMSSQFQDIEFLNVAAFNIGSLQLGLIAAFDNYNSDSDREFESNFLNYSFPSS